LTLSKHLAGELTQGLKRILGEPSHCAVLLYRDSPNAGDAAIWVSQVRILGRLGFTATYVSARDAFSADELRHRVPRGPILISGGGSLGTRWGKTHAFKERVIEEFPDRQIVILPQSGHFDDIAALARFRNIAEAHRRLTVIARDRATLAELKEVDCGKELLPDLATDLWDYRGASRGKESVRYLLRQDGEAPGHRSDVPSSVDWCDPNRVVWVRRFEKRIARRSLPSLADRKAVWRLDHGLDLLAGASVVVTDRLHGMVLANHLGIPVIALDNSWGKVRNFYETWFHDDPQIAWAESLEGARALAQDFV
jgi:exopolysaccharide biosynthesis predicted pyruvyltransferase EpsI